MFNRSTPQNFLLYKHALCAFKLMNANPPYTTEWAALNMNIVFTSRQNAFRTNSDNSKRVGLNSLTNRLSILNGKIPLNWFDLGYDTYKIKCKMMFIT